MTSSADKKPRPFVKIKNLTELGLGLMGVLMHPPLLTFFCSFIYPWVCGRRKSMLIGKILGPKVPPWNSLTTPIFPELLICFG